MTREEYQEKLRREEVSDGIKLKYKKHNFSTFHCVGMVLYIYILYPHD